MRNYSLTFDFGSGSVKTALVDEAHRIAASCDKHYPIYYSERGHATQNPEVAWRSMQETIRDMLSFSGISSSTIKGIAISHTASSIIFVDKSGNALSDCVLWMDGRGVKQAGELNSILGKPLFTGKNVISKLCWFLENEPELINFSYRILDLAGYLLYRLTGKMVYEFTGARTTHLFDVRGGKWDEDRFAISGFPRHLVPEEVLLSHSLVGNLTSEASSFLSIPGGIPVFGGCCDHAAALLGAGCVHPGDAHLYVGTSAWISIAAADYEEMGSIRPSPIPGQWYHYAENDSGGTCIDYLISTYYTKELSEMTDIYTLVGKESSDESSFGRVLFLPFLTGASAPISDVRVRASLLNIDAGTTRGQIARAVLEGIGFNLLWLKELYRKQNKWNINFLRGIGGGMLLPESVQTIANILDEPMSVVNNPRFAGNIGLAVCVEVGLKEHPEGYGILGNIIACDRVFHPQKEYTERYRRLYPVYQSAFYALSDIYGILNSDEPIC
jgi:xylulokinase